MKTGKGIVKKYCREYNRTLKSGKKKKYTTEQIQITVPKNEDIYNNQEEVLIIPQSEIENFRNLENELETLKIANALNGVSALDSSLDEKYSKLIDENDNLKRKYVNIKDDYERIKEENKNLKESSENIKNSYSQISMKYDQLKQENLNTKTSYAELYELNQTLDKNYDDLLQEYNELVDKYNSLEHELYNLKNMKKHDAYIANRVKEFILKNEN